MDISYIDLPDDFKIKEEDVFQTITEALDIFGEFHDRERVNKVTVNFAKDVFTSDPPSYWEDCI